MEYTLVCRVSTANESRAWRSFQAGEKQTTLFFMYVWPSRIKDYTLRSRKASLPVSIIYVTVSGMDREHVIATLRQHAPELKAAGIVHLRLHGSVARAESQTSDVDLIAEFDPAKHLSLLDMVGLQNRLSDLLGVPVDLSPAQMLKRPVAERAAQEAILAF
jgi:predicted nucleotidyltransferase